MRAYLDSGASTSLIADVTLSSDTVAALKPHKGKVLDANGREIPILGKTDVYVQTPDGAFLSELLVFHKRSIMSNHDMLIGMNMLEISDCNYISRELRFRKMEQNNFGVNCRLILDIPREINYTQRSTIKTVFTDAVKVTNNYPVEQAVNRPKVNEVEVPDAICDNKCAVTNQIVLATNNEDKECTNNNEQDCKYGEYGGNMEFFPVHLRDDVQLPANTALVMPVKINKGLQNNKDIVIYLNEVKKGIIVANSLATVTNNDIIVNIANTTNELVTLKAGTCLSAVEYFKECHEGSEFVNKLSEEPPHTDERENSTVLRRVLVEEDIKCDDPAQTSNILSLLNKYRDVCWLPGEPLGKYQGDQLEIITTNDEIINKAPYRIPYALQAPLDKEIKSLEAEGIITRSKSAYNAPLIIVKKPDGSIRPCIDYRELNKVIRPVNYPLPRITDLLNELGDAVYVSSLDLASAYHQCELKPTDREKTAFTVRNCKFEFVRVPFGLKTAPGYFARVINDVLYEVLGPNVLAYMDDILVFTRTPEEHLQRLEDVLKRLSEAQIKLKTQKCLFLCEQVPFLGYLVTKDGLKMNPERAQAIKAMPYPENKRTLQAFLGAINYYRLFIANFATLSEPLYKLLRKNVKFEWSKEQSEAVDLLKNRLINAPIMKFPDFTQPFVIHTDASNTGIGAVLSQEKNGVLHPISYVSRTLTEAQRNYSVTKKEALSLVFALEQFRHIILHFKVNVYTDHKPLLGVISKPTKDDCLHRWSLLIQEYDVQLHYIEGRDNLIADVLSRLPDKQQCTDASSKFDDELNKRNESCKSLHSFIPIKTLWSERKLRKAQAADPFCQSLNNNLNSEGKMDANHDKLVLKTRSLNGILYILREIKRGVIKDKFLVPIVPLSLMASAFELIHSQITAGHRGYDRTYKLFCRNFYNPDERKLLKAMCAECEVCTRAKGNPELVPLSKYPIPKRPFDNVSIDIIGPLRVTEDSNQYILAIRDFTTRYTVLYPLEYKATDNVIAALRNFVSHYGAPTVILSDNAPEFVSEKLIKFCVFYNINKKEVAPYHASSQGLVERINREVNKFLRMYTYQLAIHDWDRLLPAVQLALNNTFNASIGESPFFALFGYDSSSVTFTQPKINYSEDDLSSHLARVAMIREYCLRKLLEIQDRYTQAANRNRKEKSIEIGQRVYARLNKHKLLTKLDLPISGPLKVIQRKGKAWKLQECATQKTFLVHPDYILTRGNAFLPAETENADLEGTNQCAQPLDLAPTITSFKAEPVGEASAVVSTDAPGNESESVQTDVPRRIQPHRQCKGQSTHTQ